MKDCAIENKDVEGIGASIDMDLIRSKSRSRKFFVGGGLVTLFLVALGYSSKNRNEGWSNSSSRNLSNLNFAVGIFNMQRDVYWRKGGDNQAGGNSVDNWEYDEDEILGADWEEIESVSGVNGINLGYSVTMASNRTRFAVGCPYDGENNEGSVLTFKKEEEEVGGTIEGDTEDEEIGRSIAMSENGDYMIVGEPNASSKTRKSEGRARVFKNGNFGGWELMGMIRPLTTSGALCGSSVSIADSGERVVIGCPGVGNAFVYDLNIKNKWVQVGKTLGSGGEVGAAVSMSHDGKYAAVTNPGKGEVVLFEVGESDWKQIGNESGKMGDSFGTTLSLSNNEHAVRLAVGGNSEVRISQYVLSSKMWQNAGSFHIGARSLSLAANYFLAMGIPQRYGAKGFARVLRQDNGEWKLIGSIMGRNPGDEFGKSLVLDKDDGSLSLLVGAPGANEGNGTAKLYEYKL